MDFDEAERSGMLYFEGKKKGEEFVSAFETAVQKRNGFMTDWGPVGYTKKLHPFSVMVKMLMTMLS